MVDSLNSANIEMDGLEKKVYSIKLGDINYDESLKLAEDDKECGNKFLLDNKFGDALTKFTDAINHDIETKRNAIYYSNRAVVHLRMENTGLAIQGELSYLSVLDANKAIEIDPGYLKAYYRRASGNLFLSHYDDALKDFEFLLTKIPNDEGLVKTIKETKKAKRKKLFFESIVSGRTDEE